MIPGTRKRGLRREEKGSKEETVDERDTYLYATYLIIRGWASVVRQSEGCELSEAESKGHDNATQQRKRHGKE